MKKISKILASFLAVFIMLTSVGCGSSEAETGGRVKISFWAGVSKASLASVQQLVDNFNASQDEITVVFQPKSTGYAKDLATVLKAKVGQVDVVQTDDRYFKNYVNEGYFTCFDDYLKDSDFKFDDIWETAVNRYRYNPETGYSGGDNPVYALPVGVSPVVIYYNADVFKAQKINIISVQEDALSEYNAQNQTSYLPHGYYVYDNAPAANLQAREDGKYYVFNNRIGMNWSELVELSKIFTKTYNSATSSYYGFFNEWWFSHGWSIGGDCLEYSDTEQQFLFSLGDDVPNYLVTGNDVITVNGNTYKSGDLISYNDKHFIANNKDTDATIKSYLNQQKLYEFPSTRDAFTEFCALSQEKGKLVSSEKDVYGYGISPSPTTLNNLGKSQYFLSGRVVMMVDSYSNNVTYASSLEQLGVNWDYAVLNQYREYNSDGSLKVVNGTPVVGKESVHSVVGGYAMPANSKKNNYAWKFIKYMCSADAQKILSDSGVYVPNQKSVAYSSEFLNNTAYGAANKWAVVRMSEKGTVGDWSYVEDGEWINGWADVLNTDVRNGVMTLEQFFVNSQVKETDEILKKYKAKKFNG